MMQTLIGFLFGMVFSIAFTFMGMIFYFNHDDFNRFINQGLLSNIGMEHDPQAAFKKNNSAFSRLLSFRGGYDGEQGEPFIDQLANYIAGGEKHRIITVGNICVPNGYNLFEELQHHGFKILAIFKGKSTWGGADTIILQHPDNRWAIIKYSLDIPTAKKIGADIHSVCFMETGH